VEPKWSAQWQDRPLTDNGRRLAERVRPVLAAKAFALVLCSPMQRARETGKLAGLGDKAVIVPDLIEWNYAKYEGLTPQQIPEIAPGWLVFRDGCQGGESPNKLVHEWTG
jgi:broad specificity phosphatase PhoE